MQMRSVARWLCVLGIVTASASPVVSCGSGGDQSTFHPGGQGDDGPIGSGDGTMSADSQNLFGHDGSSSGGEGGGCKKCRAGIDCGPINDGCGNMIQCGSSCPSGEFCGGGGFNICGKGDGGGSSSSGGGDGGVCKPATTCGKNAAGQQENCGFEGDGCGGPAISCGSTCASPEYCGGGGFNVCGGNTGLGPDGSVPCTAATACSGGQNCGFQGDGCGGSIACGSCTSPAFCGGGGFNICGGNNGLLPDGGTLCHPETCATLGLNCGPTGDGCGGLIATCGTCVLPNICGGGGVPGSCGNSACTGLCQQQQGCGGGPLTTVSGKVIAGTIPMFGTPDPVPNVLVYIPNQPLDNFSVGVQCSQCGAEVSGAPLVETKTAFDGTFTLTNVPVGANIPIVIQLGRWRRETFLANVPACTTTAGVVLQMPQTQLQGDIPLTAISTGSVDSLECVLLKMGVDVSEFTLPTGGGRMQIYEGNGSSLGGTTPAETALMGTPGSYMSYDQILFPCWGGEIIKPAAELANLVTYANGGGHFFATHYSYTWLFQNNPFNTTAQWNVNYNSFGSGVAQVQVPPVNPQGTVFTNWLHLVGALPAPPNLTIQNPRHDVNAVNAPSVDWMSGPDPGNATPMLYHYTFDTPVGGSQQCGHVIFSDFHVANAATGPGTIFPAECMKNETTGVTCSNAAPCPMTPQEKVLEYMIWDLGQCVPGPPTPPSCTPQSCQQQGISCGPAGDGCGNLIPGGCGSCTPPLTCGGGGTPGVCGAPDGGACAPKTCSQLSPPVTCGPAGDGCGNLITSCGTCTPPQTCGGGGVPGQCGFPDGGACQPLSCSQQNIFCGPAGDGCGNEIPSCGMCKAPQTCGGGGTPGQCGAPDAGGGCKPTSCSAQGLSCGPASDGCGNSLNCGMCVAPQTCQNGKCVGAQ